MNNKFSIGEALKFGWSATKVNFAFFIFVMIFLAILQALPQLFEKVLPSGPLFLSNLFFWVLGMVTTLGFISMTIKAVDGKKVAFEDLFTVYPLVGHYIISSILYGVAVMAGLILFIVPGVIVAIRFMYAPYLIADEKLSAIDAFQKSAHMTKGVVRQIFLLGIASILLNIAGALFFGIGLLVTLPVTFISYAYVYRKLNSPSGSPEQKLQDLPKAPNYILHSQTE